MRKEYLDSRQGSARSHSPSRASNNSDTNLNLATFALGMSFKARITLRIEIKIGLEFNQSEERKLVSGLVNFALIGQIQSQSLV